jgi:hypothetical protein
MSWKVNLLYFPSESFGALVCCNRRRFEKTFWYFWKKKKKERKKKRCERGGKGRLLHSPNVTRRLDLGLKILSNPRQSFTLLALSFFLSEFLERSRNFHLFLFYLLLFLFHALKQKMKALFKEN